MLHLPHAPPSAAKAEAKSAAISPAVSLILLFACGPAVLDGAAPQGDPVPFVTVAKGAQSGIGSPRRLVIRERRDWQRLWAEHASIFIPAAPLPAVDFSKEMVVAVYSGERPSGGFSVEIREVRRRGSGLIVRYVESSPRSGAASGSVLTQPFHIIRCGRAPDSVDFEPISETR